jgi:hypothetical protein
LSSSAAAAVIGHAGDELLQAEDLLPLPPLLSSSTKKTIIEIII